MDSPGNRAVSWSIPWTEERMSTEIAKKNAFTDALREKYLADDADKCQNNFVIKIDIRGKPADSSRGKAELGFLRNVVLSDSNIDHAGLPDTGLKFLCPNVVDLDLSSNNLQSWKEIFNILSELPHLKYINLAGNQLKYDSDLLSRAHLPLPAVENLVLNRTKMDWKSVTAICRHFPGVSELHICGNGYRTISNGCLPHLCNVECLRLNDNRLQRWEEVWKLGKLPKLRELILSNNPISGIFYWHDSLPSEPETACTETAGCHSDVCDASAVAPSPESDARDTGEVSREKIMHAASAVCQNIINEVMETVCARRRGSAPDCMQETATHMELSDTVCASPSLTPKTTQPNLAAPRHTQQGDPGQSSQSECDPLVISPEAAAETQPHNLSMGPHVPTPIDASAESETTTLSEIKGLQELPTTSGQDAQLASGAEAASSLVTSLPWARNIHPSNEIHSKVNDPTAEVDASQGTETEETSSQLGRQNLSEDPDATLAAVASCADEGECSSPTHTNQASGLTPFISLESLSISDSHLSSLNDLWALSKFPKLHSLRIKNTKLLQNADHDDRRMVFIACLTNIKILNGSEISESERNKSERYFLRHHQDDALPWLQPLKEKHGNLEQLRDINLSRGFTEWADITIMYQNHPVHSFPAHVTECVGNLRTYIAENVLFVPKKSICMYHYACGPHHIDEEETTFDELFLDSLPMSRFNIMNGDEIHVEIVEGKRPKSLLRNN